MDECELKENTIMCSVLISSTESLLIIHRLQVTPHLINNSVYSRFRCVHECMCACMRACVREEPPNLAVGAAVLNQTGLKFVPLVRFF